MTVEILKILLTNIKEDGEHQKVIDFLNRSSMDVRKTSMDAMLSDDRAKKDAAIISQSFMLLTLFDVLKEMTNDVHNAHIDISKKLIEELKGENDDY